MQKAACELIAHWLTDIGLNRERQTGFFYFCLKCVWCIPLNYQSRFEKHETQPGPATITVQSSLRCLGKQAMPVLRQMRLGHFNLESLSSVPESCVRAARRRDYEKHGRLPACAAVSKFTKRLAHPLWPSGCLMWVTRVSWDSCSTET